jgi:hypothetical protein
MPTCYIVQRKTPLKDCGFAPMRRTQGEAAWAAGGIANPEIFLPAL